MKESPARKVFRAFLVTTACIIVIAYGASKYIDWSKSKHPDGVFVLNKIATHNVTIQYGEYSPETFCVSIFNVINRHGELEKNCDVKSYKYDSDKINTIVIATGGVLNNIYGSLLGRKESLVECYLYGDHDNYRQLLYSRIFLKEDERAKVIDIAGKQFRITISEPIQCDSSAYVERGLKHDYSLLYGDKEFAELYAKRLNRIGSHQGTNFKVFYNVELAIIRQGVERIDSMRVRAAQKAGGHSIVPDAQLSKLADNIDFTVSPYGGASGEPDANSIEHWELRLDNRTWSVGRTNTDYEAYYYVHDSSEIQSSTFGEHNASWVRFPELSGHSIQIGGNVFQNAFTGSAFMFVTAAGDVAVVNVKRLYLPK